MLHPKGLQLRGHTTVWSSNFCSSVYACVLSIIATGLSPKLLVRRLSSETCDSRNCYFLLGIAVSYAAATHLKARVTFSLNVHSRDMWGLNAAKNVSPQKLSPSPGILREIFSFRPPRTRAQWIIAAIYVHSFPFSSGEFILWLLHCILKFTSCKRVIFRLVLMSNTNLVISILFTNYGHMDVFLTDGLR